MNRRLAAAIGPPFAAVVHRASCVCRRRGRGEEHTWMEAKRIRRRRRIFAGRRSNGMRDGVHVERGQSFRSFSSSSSYSLTLTCLQPVYTLRALRILIDWLVSFSHSFAHTHSLTYLLTLSCRWLARRVSRPTRPSVRVFGYDWYDAVHDCVQMLVHRCRDI